MNGHPGGAEHTRRMLALAELPAGARVLDMGAGAGEAVAVLSSLGYRAEGIDLRPRSDRIREGNFLAAASDGNFSASLIFATHNTGPSSRFIYTVRASPL